MHKIFIKNGNLLDGFVVAVVLADQLYNSILNPKTENLSLYLRK